MKTGRGHSGLAWGNPAGKLRKHHCRVDEGLKKAAATLLLSLEVSWTTQDCTSTGSARGALLPPFRVGRCSGGCCVGPRSWCAQVGSSPPSRWVYASRSSIEAKHQSPLLLTPLTVIGRHRFSEGLGMMTP